MSADPGPSPNPVVPSTLSSPRAGTLPVGRTASPLPSAIRQRTAGMGQTHQAAVRTFSDRRRSSILVGQVSAGMAKMKRKRVTVALRRFADGAAGRTDAPFCHLRHSLLPPLGLLHCGARLASDGTVPGNQLDRPVGTFGCLMNEF